MTEPHGGASERPIGRRRGDRIVGAGRATQMAMEQARMAARSDRPVLVHGPDGSGKMHLARAIHSWSARAQGPLVRVSCGGLGEGLLARELFGCAPGSSAQLPEEHIGALARAAGGTLVLARVERLAASVLDALCKALEAGRYERQGDGAGETLRARLVLTAVGLPEGGPLAALVGHEIRLEALRERQEDVLALAAHFLRIAAEEEGVTPVGFTSDARVALLAEPWPGNVRELAERVHQAVRLSGGGAVGGAGRER